MLPPPQIRFFSNLLCFREMIEKSLRLEESEIITSELIDAAFSFVEQLDKDDLIMSFINKTHPLWKEISGGRNLQNMLEKSFILFGDIGEDKINEIARLVTVQDSKGGEDVEKAWKLLEGLVKISIKYVHEQREPTTKYGKNYYQNPNFMPAINIEDYAKCYDLKLSW